MLIGISIKGCVSVYRTALSANKRTLMQLLGIVPVLGDLPKNNRTIHCIEIRLEDPILCVISASSYIRVFTDIRNKN